MLCHVGYAVGNQIVRSKVFVRTYRFFNLIGIVFVLIGKRYRSAVQIGRKFALNRTPNGLQFARRSFCTVRKNNCSGK